MTLFFLPGRVGGEVLQNIFSRELEMYPELECPGIWRIFAYSCANSKLGAYILAPASLSPDRATSLEMMPPVRDFFKE
jgi:hypothetical protein